MIRAHKIFLGELALDGRLRPVNGALNIAQMAVESGFHQLFLPAQNANEAAAIEGVADNSHKLPPGGDRYFRRQEGRGIFPIPAITKQCYFPVPIFPK